jgi:HK97 family phage major capsid protein
MRTIEEIEARLSQITEELEQPEADLDALKEEVRTLKSEKEELRKAAEAEKEERIKAANEGITVKTFEEEERTMEKIEVRNTPAYIDAFAEYIKSGDATECRKLITENTTNGTVPVPEYVEAIVKNAWENDELMGLVRKTYFKGNVKVGFEISATGAVIHTEGSSAPSEEALVLGIVTMVPQSIKKWITLSDEALDMRGTEFLDYIYDELTHHIIHKAADTLIAKITASTAAGSATAPAVPAVTVAAGMDTVVQAIGALSDQASDNTVVLNKATWAAIKGAAMTNYYGADPFDGLRVVFNNSLPAFASASSGAVYMIVGDFGYGAQANFPNGDGVAFKFDDLSLAEEDLVKIVGRQYVALNVVAPNAFVNVKKPSA